MLCMAVDCHVGPEPTVFVLKNDNFSIKRQSDLLCFDACSLRSRIDKTETAKRPETQIPFSSTYPMYLDRMSRNKNWKLDEGMFKVSTVLPKPGNEGTGERAKRVRQGK